jgi:hypothetical protein
MQNRDSFTELVKSIESTLAISAKVEKTFFADNTNTFFSVKPRLLQNLILFRKIIIPEELPYRLTESEDFEKIFEELSNLEVSAIIPIGHENTFIGAFILQRRCDMSAFSLNEINDLKKFQRVFTEALWNARLYQQAISRIKI